MTHRIPRPQSGPARRRARRGAGFTVIEAALAVFVLTMMGLLFGAVLPICLRGSQQTSAYSQAALIAQRKLDQMRAAGYGKLNLAGMQSLNIVNAQNADGSFDFTTVDHLTGAGGFFTAPNTGHVGTITVSDFGGDVTAQDQNTSVPPAGNVRMVTVTLAWGGAAPGTYSASGLIVNMLHQ